MFKKSRFLRLISSLFACIFLLQLTSLTLCALSNSDTNNRVYLIDIDAAIGPASSDYLQQSMQFAHQKNAHLVIVKLNTPGGLASSMREMTKTILSSNIPVAVYVSPSGSYAASAGAFIVYSAHIASMAPGTNIGAASPIPLGQDVPMPKDTPVPNGDNTPKGETTPLQDTSSSTAQTKAIEDLTAYMRSLAELNNRNSKLGVEMITKGSSFTAKEALDQSIINFISTDINELLKQLDGKTITIKQRPVTLSLKNATIVPIKPSWRYEFLKIITDPNVTYILLIAGIYGILFELYSPGVLFPGILGFICLILSGYGLHLLPINYAGLFLVVLGVILIATETFVTSYGVLGIGGFIAFIIGSVFLLDTLYPVYSISKSVIGAMAVLTVTILTVIANFVFRSLRSPHMTGGSEMIGKEATVIASFSGSGQVECEGAIYFATTLSQLKAKQKVIVSGVRGIRLIVTPKTKQPKGA
ncbi:MAG: nodulation protein NfeD [Pseudomonadota bacterium]|nr:nodulation protein NfeD [Pseudomonadota bacterium]